MIEQVAELEHKQWAHWTKHMLDNLTPENIERWRVQIETPYSELTEKEKDSDRVWAKAAIEAMREPSDDVLKVVCEKMYTRNGFTGLGRLESKELVEAMINTALEG